MSHLVAPSLLAADFGKLAQEIEMINRSEADWLTSISWTVCLYPTFPSDSR